MCTKKHVATPFDATTSFLRLEPITQWEYITRKPPEDILCINQHSHGETDHVPDHLSADLPSVCSQQQIGIV